MSAKITKPGQVEKIIKPIDPNESDKAQIRVEGAEPLYEELRIENVLKDEDGKEVQLKEGAEVDVHIEADPHATEPKKKKK
jgi:predicted DNA-binding antitoxin AbrB/MazE fold protein